MKETFLMFIFLILFSSIKAQNEISGKYKFYSEDIEPGSLILNCNKTFIMEDTMVVSKDSTISSTVKGSWKIKRGEILVLYVDSIISQFKAVGNLKRLKYLIKNDRFYLELRSKRQYARDNKKLDKKFQTCMPGSWEDYETYKAKQNNRYFFIVDNFNCP